MARNVTGFVMSVLATKRTPIAKTLKNLTRKMLKTTTITTLAPASTLAPLPPGCKGRLTNSGAGASDLVPGDNLYGYFVVALALLGILGNIGNMVVLADRRHNTPTFIYLLFLSIANFLALLNYCIDTMAKMSAFEALQNPYFYSYVLWPIGSVASTWSLITSVALIIDRYFFIDMIKKQMTVENSKRRAIYACSLIWIVATVVSLPRMLAFKVHDDFDCVTFRWNTRASNWLFKVYSNVRLIMFNYGSMMLLVIFNCLLLESLIRSLSKIHSKSVENSIRRQKPLTLTVVILIFAILLAEFPCTLLTPTSAAVIWGSAILNSPAFRAFHVAAIVLMLLEYSSVFIVLVSCSSAYRRMLAQKLLPCFSFGAPVSLSPQRAISHTLIGITAATTLLAPKTRQTMLNQAHKSLNNNAKINNGQHN